MRHHVSNSIIWLFMLMASLSPSVFANMTVSVDKSTVSINEPITLTIESDSQSATPSQAFMQALKRQFTVVSQSTSKRFSMINGNIQQSAALILVIQAQQAGRLSIPALGNSPSIDITVTDAPAQANPSAPSTQQPNAQQLNTASAAYVETLLDKTSVFVQEQVILTVRLFSVHPIMESNYQPPDIPGMEIAQLVSAKYDDNVNGQHYYIHEYKYALFSKRSGSIEVPSTYLKARIVDNRNTHNRMFNFNVGRIINVKAPMALLEVKPVPSQVTGDWLPASDVDINDEWNVDLSALKVGDTIQRTIKLRVTSAAASHVNPPSFDNVPGLKIYPDTANKDLMEVDTGVETYLQQSVSYVLTESARYTLEPISIQWWNTNTGQLETTTLPAQQLDVRDASGNVNQQPRSSTVVGAPTSANNSPQKAANQPDNETLDEPSASLWSLLRWAMLLLALLVLAGVATWWARTKRRVPEKTSETAFTFDALSSACQQTKLKPMQRELIAWGRFEYGDDQIHTLSDISQRVSSSALKQQLSLLDTALFSSRTPEALNAKNILTLVQQEPKRTVRVESNASTATLPTLYPK